MPRTLDQRRVPAAGPWRSVSEWSRIETEDRTETDVTGLDEEDEAGRQVAHITGMSADAAATFAAFVSGRFAHRSAFRDAA